MENVKGKSAKRNGLFSNLLLTGPLQRRLPVYARARIASMVGCIYSPRLFPTTSMSSIFIWR